MLKISPQNTNVIINSTPEAVQFVANRIRLARHIRHISLESLASQLGITRKQLQNYETAKSNISVARLWEISRILDIETSFFVEGMNGEPEFISNADLDVIRLLHNIKDKNIKKALVDFLQEL